MQSWLLPVNVIPSSSGVSRCVEALLFVNSTFVSFMTSPAIGASSTKPVDRSALSELLQETSALTRRLFLQLQRRPSTLVAGVLQPLIWLVLFGALFSRAPEGLLPGGMSYGRFLGAGVIVLGPVKTLYSFSSGIAAGFAATWATSASSSEVRYSLGAPSRLRRCTRSLTPPPARSVGARARARGVGVRCRHKNQSNANVRRLRVDGKCG